MPIDVLAIAREVSPEKDMRAPVGRPSGPRRPPGAASRSESWHKRLLKLELTRSKGISAEEMVLFTGQLAMLLESGNGLVPSIKAFASQAGAPELKSVLEDIAYRIEEGRGLSEALELHPQHFDAFFISVVRAGEASGELQRSLEQLASTFETRQRLRSRVIEALTYPAVLSVVMVGVLIFVFSYMLPRFAVLFADVMHELPWTTRVLLTASTILRSSWQWLIPISVLSVVALVKVWASERVRPLRDDLKMRLPLLSRLYQQGYLFQLFLSMGMLLESRVPHLVAIDIARHTVRNATYARFFDRLSDSVEAGAGMAQAFMEAAFLPETVKLMVSTGEQAGDLDRVMVRLSRKYQEDLECDIRKLSSVIEPAMLVVMGLAVGAIATSLIIPIFKLSKTVH